jgi:hypothetical protein
MLLDDHALRRPQQQQVLAVVAFHQDEAMTGVERQRLDDAEAACRRWTGAEQTAATEPTDGPGRRADQPQHEHQREHRVQE